MSDLDELEELANMVQNMALCGLGKSAPLPVISTDVYKRQLLDVIVFGRNAGKKAAAKCKNVELGEMNLDHIYKYAEELDKAEAANIACTIDLNQQS